MTPRVKLPVEQVLITNATIKPALKAAKTGRAPGPDKIPTEVLKVVQEANPDLIGTLLNRCMTEGRFPDSWKRAKAILIPKGEAGSYRPICLLDTLGKTLKRILADKILDHMTRHKGISPQQYGFTPGRSTTDALIDLRDTVETQRKARRTTIAVAIDIKNDFNTAKWRWIISELEEKAVPEHLVTMIRDYLCNRVIYYETPGHKLERLMTMGVPQGSVLGPVLWNIMFDGIIGAIAEEGVKAICYADDTLVVASGKNPKEASERAEAAAKRAATWVHSRGLEMAVRKTEAILFAGRGQKGKPAGIMVEGALTRFSETIKYLGVHLDKRMRLDRHVELSAEKAKNTARRLGALMPNIGGPKAPRRKFYATVAESIVLYGAPV